MVWVQVGTQTGRPNVGGYWAVSQYTVQYPGILDGIPGYWTVSQDTGRYHRIPDGIQIPSAIRIPSGYWMVSGYSLISGYLPETDIRQYPDAAVAWRTDTDIRIRPDIRFLRIRLRALVADL